ncbi:hypothetical protein e2017b09.tmp0021 [Eimeria tenella]|uniref:Uncharacterized protein n=1 Tax=Eimeria tenella TaxID=5802 RepID=C8TDV0_EIMTE|nr:hypothetical protein e2017b09.tmp0021 [Eimeria tenella]
MHLRNGPVIFPTQQETSTNSVSKMPNGMPAHHRHATPKPTVAERPHGHKEAPPQLAPIANAGLVPFEEPFYCRLISHQTNDKSSIIAVIFQVLKSTFLKSPRTQGSCFLGPVGGWPAPVPALSPGTIFGNVIGAPGNRAQRFPYFLKTAALCRLFCCASNDGSPRCDWSPATEETHLLTT